MAQTLETMRPLVPVFRGPRDLDHEDVLVAIPAFNEERFIGSVVHAVRMEGFQSLVIDDGSSDRTAAIAAAAGAVVERHGTNLGKAAALNTAFRYARNHGVSVLVAMDGDAQHDARAISMLVEPIRHGNADIVTGSRFLAEGQDGIPRVRRAGLRAFTATSNALSGGLITDTLSGFRAFGPDAIEAMRFKSDRFAVEMEMQFLVRGTNLRHVEVPITVSYADPPKRNVVGYGLGLLDGLVHLVGRYRPLLFFGMPGVVSTATGVVLGLIVVDVYQQSRELAVGLAMLAVLLVILGSIGSFAAILLHVLRGMFIELEADVHALRETRPATTGR